MKTTRWIIGTLLVGGAAAAVYIFLFQEKTDSFSLSMEEVACKNSEEQLLALREAEWNNYVVDNGENTVSGPVATSHYNKSKSECFVNIYNTAIGPTVSARSSIYRGSNNQLALECEWSGSGFEQKIECTDFETGEHITSRDRFQSLLAEYMYR